MSLSPDEELVSDLEHLPSVTDLTFRVKMMALGWFSLTEMSDNLFEDVQVLWCIHAYVGFH